MAFHPRQNSMLDFTFYFSHFILHLFILQVLWAEEKVSRPHSSWKSFDGNVSGGGLGELSPPITLGRWPADESTI